MHRQAADPSINPYPAYQMQHMSAQRTQQNAEMNNFPGYLNSLSAEKEHPYKSSKVESHWQWDRDVPRASGPLNEGQGSFKVRSFYQGQNLDAQAGLENQQKRKLTTQPHEQDMEIGYEDTPSALSFEGLERKFLDEITKLAKEHSDAEDAENARHREKIIEINTRYQEKLAALRTQQGSRREEFLHKESQARLHHYRQLGLLANTSMQDTHSYGENLVAGAAGEAHRPYANSQLGHLRDRSQFLGNGRTQGAEGRVPFPQGRVYNTGPRC